MSGFAPPLTDPDTLAKVYQRYPNLAPPLPQSVSPQPQIAPMAGPNQTRGLGPAPAPPATLASHIGDIVQGVEHHLGKTQPQPLDLGTGAKEQPPLATPRPQIQGLGPPLSTGGNTPAQAEYERLHHVLRPDIADPSGSGVTLPGEQAHTSADTGVSGIQQIHNPFLRGLASVGDAIGSAVVPRIMQGIPGTELHHEKLANAATQNVGEEQAVQNEESKRQLEAAQSEKDLNPAKTHEAPKTLETSEGIKTWNSDTGRWELGAGQPYVKPSTAEGEIPLKDEEIASLNKTLPPEQQLPKGATEKQFDRLEKVLTTKQSQLDHESQSARTAEDRERAHADQVANQQALRAIASAREARQEEGGGKEDHQIRSAAFKAYTPALDSAERFNVMTQNYEHAVKNGDQQAMLSLLANHLGMTMGLNKGARITKDIIHEAETSRPWLQGMGAKFDDRGVLSGVTLSPQQMRQMVGLAQERFGEDISKARNEAKYQGAKDDGPDRTPGKATMNYYLGQTNGDVVKAKAAAAADGWSVK